MAKKLMFFLSNLLTSESNQLLQRVVLMDIKIEGFKLHLIKL